MHGDLYLSSADGSQLYKWIQDRFTVEARSESVDKVRVHLAELIQPADRVLDLCCGGGAFSFLVEQLGGEATGIDIAPYMIERAVAEAAARGSTATFLHGDVLEFDLGVNRYDLVILMGNTLTDFSASQFAELARRVHHWLKPDGIFAIDYIDGALLHASLEGKTEGLEQDRPVRVSWRFKQFILEEAAFVVTYRNEATGEEHDYTSYLYHVPSVQAELRFGYERERLIPLSERSVLDIYRRKE